MPLVSDLVVVIHLAYVTFVGVGFVLICSGAWLGWPWIRNPLFRWLHLGCIGLVAVEVVAGVICPLTLLENRLLIGGGGVSYERSFIGNLVYDLLYYDLPGWVFSASYLSLAAFTALLMFWAPPRRRRRSAP